MLSWLEIPFEVVESGVDESIYPDEEVSEAVARLAMAKTQVVAKKIEEQRVFGEAVEEGELVMGADTMVCVGDRIMGKPVDRENAKEMIQLIQGRTHEVWTGICVIDVDTEEQRVEVDRTLVTLMPMSEQQIEDFLETKEWEGKAGGYQIQESMAAYVKDVEGSFTNVIGLPLLLAQDLLEGMGCPTEVDLRQIIELKTGHES